MAVILSMACAACVILQGKSMEAAACICVIRQEMAPRETREKQADRCIHRTHMGAPKGCVCAFYGAQGWSCGEWFFVRAAWSVLLAMLLGAGDSLATRYRRCVKVRPWLIPLGRRTTDFPGVPSGVMVGNRESRQE
jgi:hypothetical protein